MNIYYIIFIPLWVLFISLIFFYVLYRKILPKYKMTVSEVSFQELLIALNAAIQTEFELWEKDVFVDKKAITNSNFDNYYMEVINYEL